MKRRNEQVAAGWAAALCCAFVLACGTSNGGTQKADVGGAGGTSSDGGSGPTQALAGNGPTQASGGSGVVGGRSGSVSGATGQTAGAGGASDLAAPLMSYWEFAENGDADDIASAVGVDATENVYVAGITQSALNGPLTGTFDVFVRKYDLNGSVLWTQQWGKVGYNYFSGMAVAAQGGFFYVAGDTVEFALGERATHYINKYDSSGKLLQTQEATFKTAAIALDSSNNLYVADRGAPASSTLSTLRKFDATNAGGWAKQFGSPGIESAVEIAIDHSGNIYVASNTLGTVQDPNTGRYAGLLYKFDRDGTLVRSQPFAGASDAVSGIAVDLSGNVYAAGHTDPALSAPSVGSDALLLKYDADGRILWSRQFGTSLAEVTYALELDSLGNPYIAGVTEGALVGPQPSVYAGFVRKYDPSGREQWTAQCSPSSVSRILSLAVAKSGNVYGVGDVNSNVLVVKIDAL